MNNCRAGLYSFAPTAIWLRELGMASPPFLVMLGLTLPDARILNGIAGIGMTLANITILLPHLRRTILDSIRASECARTNEQSTRELVSCGSDYTHPAVPTAESSTLVSPSLCDKEHQRPPLICNTSIKSCSTVCESLESSNVDTHAPHAALLPVGKTGIPSRTHRSPGVEFTEKLACSNNLLTRANRSALQIPLPVPDTVEIVFFDTTCTLVSIHDLELGELSAAEKHSAMGDERLVIVKDIEHGIAPDEMCGDVEMMGPPGDLISGGVPLRHNLMIGGKDLAKQRPESLQFIPQSVIRRYPSASLVSGGCCFGHRAGAFSSGHDCQCTQALPHALEVNPAILLDESNAAFLTESQPNGPLMGRQTFVFEVFPTQDPLARRLSSLPEPPTAHKLTTLEKYPIHGSRPGTLARAAFRNRRSAGRRYRSNGIDGSSTSDSESESDGDSKCSSESGGSSEDESLLPHILGADLIAAIDANSESGLNLAGYERANHVQLDQYHGFPVSEDSTADVSMIMHVSSIEDASDGEVDIPATLRALTCEDIQQWASGVVQKCVRQVCRGRAPVEPLSPSQASDICAERPSGQEISQCPLSGLHCKLGAAASTQVPVSSTHTLPARKPLSARNLRNIPEFVPRQRRISVVAGREEEEWKSTRSTIDVARDAATEVIARLENQAGFKNRQWLGGMNATQKSSVAGHGFQSATRCA